MPKTKPVPGKKSKGRAETVHATRYPLTRKLYEQHVRGEQGLGIVPIDESSMCRFGAVDIDVYDGLDHKQINAVIVEKKLPLVPTYSKSGGMHLWLFTEQAIPAKQMQDKLREMASFFGFAKAEIFPKQTKLNIDRGDNGQWINLPYFGKTRLGISPHGHPLKLDDFCLLARSRMLRSADVDGVSVDAEEKLKGAPPCLLRLLETGFPEGSRNNGMYNMGVYAKKAHPDRWKKMMDTWNKAHMDPPLGSGEMETVKRSLDKKTYFYKCGDKPICDFCDKAKCAKQEFGIQRGGNYLPKVGSLTMLDLEPPIFFVELEAADGIELPRVECSVDQLYSQILFHKRCMVCAKVVPDKVKDPIWQSRLKDLFEDCHVQPMPEDATASGQLMQYLMDFILQQAKGEFMESMDLGRIWETENFWSFRMTDFMAFLKHENFKELGRGAVAKVLRDKGVMPEQLQSSKTQKNMRFWRLRKEVGPNVTAPDKPTGLRKPPFA